MATKLELQRLDCSLPPVVMDAFQLVDEDHTSLSRTRLRHRNPPKEAERRVDFRDWRSTIQRLKNSPEFCKAATTFERRYPQDVQQWHVYLSSAVNFPRQYMAEDKRTDAEKIGYVESVLHLVEKLWSLISPDFILSSGDEFDGPGDGLLDPVPLVYEQTDINVLWLLKNVRTEVICHDIRFHPKRYPHKTIPIQGSFTPHDLATIAQHLIEPLKEHILLIKNGADLSRRYNVRSDKMYGILALDDIFRNSENGRVSRLYGLDPLLVATINAVLGCRGDGCLDRKHLDDMRRHYKKALTRKSTEQSPRESLRPRGRNLSRKRASEPPGPTVGPRKEVQVHECDDCQT
jgi:hypothetical protein